MRIKTFQGGFDDNLSYIISCDKTNRCALIDASVSSTQIVEHIDNNNLLLDKILVTHTHHDHISYLDEYLHKFPGVTICGYSKTIYDLLIGNCSVEESIKDTKIDNLKLISSNVDLSGLEVETASENRRAFLLKDKIENFINSSTIHKIF